MNKLKYLAQNTAIFGISQFTSKIMVFLLLPLYTSYMTTTEYGNADLVVSTVSLLLPIFTVQIASAIMRFAIEDKEKSRVYFTNSIKVIAIGFVLLLIGVPIFIKVDLFGEHLYLFYLLYITNAVYTLLSYYARALDEIKLVGIVGVINTLIVVVGNILLLVWLRQGVFGYLVSYVLGYFVGIVIFMVVLRKHISFGNSENDKVALKDMMNYSLPLVPNSVSWWGVSSANKYIINGYLSQSVLGLYSVALKIPTIINTIQNILAEALVLSVLREYDGKEKEQEYFSLLYKMYNFSITLFTGGIILGTKILAYFLFANEFYEAWIYVPLLCIPSVWGALSGYLGTFYAASKKNNGMFISTILGGIVTVGFSIVTINSIGIMGVIIGNLLSYFIIWLYRWIDVKKFVKIETNILKDILAWILLFFQALIVMYVDNWVWMYMLNLICISLLVIANKEIVNMVIKHVKKALAKNKQN